MKHTRFLSLFLALCLLLTACGSAAPMEDIGMVQENGYVDGIYDRAPGETTASSELTSESISLTNPAQTDRKLIKTVTIEAETEDYDQLVPALDAQILAMGGYVESRETGKFSRNRRWSTMTIRIPAEHLADFVSHVNEEANVLSTSEHTQDVTLQYADTESKITALKTEQTRLLELLSQANNLGEILEIEARLSDVTYELERYESQKRSYDNRIVYATVTLEILEVLTLTPVEDPTVWDRISDGFMESLEGVSNGLVDIFVYLIAGSPYIVVCGAVLTLIILLARKQSSKKQTKKQAPPSETP